MLITFAKKKCSIITNAQNVHRKKITVISRVECSSRSKKNDKDFQYQDYKAP